MFFDFIIFLPFVAAFLATFIATPICIKVIKKFKIMDDPRRKHPAIIHTKPTPRAGGIPLFIGVLIASLIFLPITRTTSLIILASFISLVLGILDDKLDISPYIRFLVNILTAIIVVMAGVNIPFITNPLGGILFLNAIKIPILAGFFASYFSYLVVVVWVVWVMNMLNWSKGVDGQMPGIVAISAFVIGILSLRFADPSSLIAAKLAFIIAGSSLGFLIFNFYPARIFPGYSATSIYLLLAVVSILSSAKLATAILVMGVPMMDGIFTVLRRILSGRSPFWHDKKHLHHLLLSIGFSQRYIALFYWTFSAILGALALVLSSKGKLFAIIMLLIIVFGGILFLQYLIKKADGKANL